MTTHKIEVGTVFYRSWGYDQTQVDFYAVVALTPSGKSVKLVELGQDQVDDCHVTARLTVPAAVGAEVLTKRINDRGCVKINDYDWAYVWDGKPKYVTPWGMGH